MGWIKRNLFFVVGGVVSLALLGGAGFYIYSQWARNSKANDDLNEIYQKLTTLAQQSPAPGNEKINNTEIAKEQEAQLRAWVEASAKYFQPIPGIPPGTNVSSKDYAAALSRTVDQMQRTAEESGIALPPKYGFSFEAQRSLVRFAPGSLDALSAQLGEVKAITDILFATRINALDSIQRVRVSEDDALGAAADYLDEHPVTNDLAIITPYILTFRCFSPELGRVLAGISAKGSNTFIVKTINVLPAGAAGMMPLGMPGAMPPGMMGEGAPPMRIPGENFGYPPPQAAGAAQPVPGRGGLQTMLKEQLLRVVVEIRLVKLLPKS